MTEAKADSGTSHPAGVQLLESREFLFAPRQPRVDPFTGYEGTERFLATSTAFSDATRAGAGLPPAVKAAKPENRESTAVFPPEEVAAIKTYSSDNKEKLPTTWFTGVTDGIEPKSAVLTTGFVVDATSELVLCSVTPKLGSPADIVNALVEVQKTTPQLAEAKTLVAMLESGLGWPTTYNYVSTAITKQFPGAIFPKEAGTGLPASRHHGGITLASEPKRQFVQTMQEMIRSKRLLFHEQLDKTHKAQVVKQLLDFRRVLVKPDYVWLRGKADPLDDTVTWSLALLVNGPAAYNTQLLAVIQQQQQQQRQETKGV